MLIIKPSWEPIYPKERKRGRGEERESNRDQQIAKQDLKDHSRTISSHGVPLHPPPNAGVYDACIVRLFVLLDLDWLARGKGGACRIANVTTRSRKIIKWNNVKRGHKSSGSEFPRLFLSGLACQAKCDEANMEKTTSIGRKEATRSYIRKR
ncbi:hypothetical protein G5I_02183 [Acromyrmex echinatior]|uniref:Uncharacterized protein n=1 Tax=Acromyrmex echinatior TaxID=103372 RepID=F4W9M9_ACREC|nr:hypothetical protein G5I_02183 [Acromyrmex echinatior]